MRSPAEMSNAASRSVFSKQHLQLATVAGVDEAGRVDERDAVAGGEARAREDEAGVACRQLDRDPGADLRPLAGLEARGVERVEVVAGVVVVRADGQACCRIQAPDAQHVEGWSRLPSAADRRWIHPPRHAGVPLTEKRA